MKMNYENRRYLVIPISIKEEINFSQVLETSVDTLRISTDGTKTFVKYNVNIVEEDKVEVTIDAETGEEFTYEVLKGIYGRPNIYSDEYDEYTHEEFKQILNTSEWINNEQENN